MRRQRTAAATSILSVEDLAEGQPKVGIEDGVDDRVEKTVEVAEPADDADEKVRVAAGVAAERPDEGDNEERKPADDEGSGDDRQRSRRLAFARRFPLLLRLPLDSPQRRRGRRRRRCGGRRSAGRWNADVDRCRNGG